MPSIVNGLFAGRSGIQSHGTAIAVVGDNISNASTIGFKSSRAEFEDLIAGGNTSGKTVGSGSSIASVSSISEQGTLEFTGRPLDMAVDGNGLFVVAQGAQRFYTRAGNFKVDASGFIVNQNDLAVLGFPANGSGSLEPININTIEQDSVATTSVAISGNVNAGSHTVALGAIPATPGASYAQLNDAASFSTVVDVFDSLGASHTITYFFFHDSATPNNWEVRGYVNSEDVDTPVVNSGEPRLIGSATLAFNSDGTRTTPPAPGAFDFTATPTWNNGSDPAGTIGVKFDPFTQYSAGSNILSITQDGKGVGAVTSLNIDDSGNIFALLSNGQSATIGTIGLVNFANAEGLTRVGKNLLQQSPDSGEPIVGRPRSGTLGSVKSGSIELSNVDIASEFVKIITLQRGFQANSRIITTINQLLNEIIQLA